MNGYNAPGMYLEHLTKDPNFKQAMELARMMKMLQTVAGQPEPSPVQLPEAPVREQPTLKPWQKGVGIGADVANMLATILENRKRRDRYMPTRPIPRATAFPGMMQVAERKAGMEHENAMSEYRRRMEELKLNFQQASDWRRGQQGMAGAMLPSVMGKLTRKTPLELGAEAGAVAEAQEPFQKPTGGGVPAVRSKVEEIERIFKEGRQDTPEGKATLSALGVKPEDVPLLEDEQANAIFKLALKENIAYGYTDAMPRAMGVVKGWYREQLRVPLANFFAKFNQTTDPQERAEFRDEFINQFRLDPLSLRTNE